jgi:hypothetical protein
MASHLSGRLSPHSIGDNAKGKISLVVNFPGKNTEEIFVMLSGHAGMGSMARF